MKSIIHKANSRGYEDHGWLKTHHTFSFAGYYELERMHFGALRVLNDDKVAGGMGFETHPHANMEIVSIPLSGELEHRDNMGNYTVIRQGEIQVMSAGTGVEHSEFNKNPDRPVEFLQIWIFPDRKNVQPRYDQQRIPELKPNSWTQILSPDKDDEGVWIHQQAWFNLAYLEKGKTISYKLNKPSNGVYLFILNGSVSVNNQVLDRRDGMGLWETDTIELEG